jgi:putative hydrolase of the HAD superfamily
MNHAPRKALVLDFGGVISRTMFETHDLTERALGLPAGTLTWRGPFDPESDPLWVAMQAGRVSERDYWLARTHETGTLLGQTWTRMEDFVKAARGADPDAIIRPEFREALAQVKAAGHPLAILSNELDLFYGADFRQRLTFLALFDCIVDATHTQILKPDLRAYLSVCARLGIAPEHCVFVDDQARNIAGARAAGMIPVHFDVTDPRKSYADALIKLGVAKSQEFSA